MWFSVITVTAGEIISCGIFGLILLAALKKIQKPVVPRLNGKNKKGIVLLLFGGYDTFFLYLQ